MSGASFALRPRPTGRGRWFASCGNTLGFRGLFTIVSEVSLDFNPNRTIVKPSRPDTEGRLISVLRRGAGGVGRGRSAGHKAVRPRKPRPKPQGPDAPAAHHGDRAANAGAAPYRAAAATPQSVGSGWIPRPERERRLKSQPTGGLAEESHSHRARDAGNPVWTRGSIRISANLGVARRRGHRVLPAPAFHAPSAFPAALPRRRRARAAKNRAGGALAV